MSQSSLRTKEFCDKRKPYVCCVLTLYMYHEDYNRTLTLAYSQQAYLEMVVTMFVLMGLEI